MRGRKKLFSILNFLLFLTVSLWAQEYPPPRGAVNDFTGFLSPQQQNELEQKLRDFHTATGAAIVLATFDSLGGVPIEDFAVGLFEKWKVGQKGLDNGLLIVISRAERKIRFEVGYGLEPVLPDGRCGEIIRTQMTPRFKEGDYPGGIFAGLGEAERILRRYFATGEIPKSGPRFFDMLPFIFLLIVVITIAGFFISAHRKGFRFSGHHRSRWGGFWMGGGSSGGFSGGGGGGGFGGGFGGFGGGSSGGGGATGGW